jgi:hypothetical protein
MSVAELQRRACGGSEGWGSSPSERATVLPGHRVGHLTTRSGLTSSGHGVSKPGAQSQGIGVCEEERMGTEPGGTEVASGQGGRHPDG